MPIRSRFLNYLDTVTKESEATKKLKHTYYFRKLVNSLGTCFYRMILGLISLKLNSLYTEPGPNLFYSYPITWSLWFSLYLFNFVVEYRTIALEKELRNKIFEAIQRDFSLTALDLSYKDNIETTNLLKSDQLIQLLLETCGLLPVFYYPHIPSILLIQWSFFFVVYFFSFFNHDSLSFVSSNFFKVSSFLSFLVFFNLGLYFFRNYFLNRLKQLQQRVAKKEAQSYSRWFNYAGFFDSYVQSSKLTHFLNLKKLVINKVNDKVKWFKDSMDCSLKVAYAEDRLLYLYNLLNQSFFLRYLALLVSLAAPFYGLLNVNLIASFIATWTELTQYQLNLLKVDTNVIKLDSILLENVPHYELHNGSVAFTYQDVKTDSASLSSSGIRVTDLTYTLNNRTVLDHVSFTINPKQKVAVIGPSGSGKSTLILLCAGYPEIHQSISLSDSSSNLKTNVFLIAQDSEFYQDTIKENISCGYAYDQTLLSKLELNLDPETTIYRNALLLSGGQKQRLALARAYHIIRNQKQPIIILDQSFSAVDPALKVTLLKQMLIDFEDKTFLVVTHDYQSLSSFDRILYLKEGSLIFNGSYNQLITNHPELIEFSA